MNGTRRNQRESSITSDTKTSRLEFFFSNVNRIRTLQSEEQNLAGQLTYLSFGHDLQPQMRSQALATVGQLDSIEDQMRRLARQMVPGPMPMRNYTREYGHVPISFPRARVEIVNANRAIYGPCVRDFAAPVR